MNDKLEGMEQSAYRVHIKSFPDYKHYKKTTVRGIQTYFFSQKCNSKSFLQHIRTLQHVLLLLHREGLIDNQFFLHVFSNMSSAIVAKASVILAFKFVISGNGVENTLSLTYPHKKKSRGGDISRSWWLGCRTTSPNPRLEMLHPKIKCYNKHMT